MLRPVAVEVVEADVLGLVHDLAARGEPAAIRSLVHLGLAVDGDRLAR